MDSRDEIRIKKKKKRLRKQWNLRIIHIFEVILIVFFVLGLLLPMRPKASDIEKRELASFPALSWSSLWD